MILVLDNRDSFVYNLARYVRERGAEAVVRRSDEMTLDEVAALAPSHIIISPGPCTPHEAGISTEVVRRFGPATPILGVCLGHQCIAEAYGGDVVRAGRPMHGKTSRIEHDSSPFYDGVPQPFTATRYHSLAVVDGTVPSELTVTSRTTGGVIMGVQHESAPIFGVQFHPESVLTEGGYLMLANWLAVAGLPEAQQAAKGLTPLVNLG